MKRLTGIVRNFTREEEGAALVEYGMLVLLIAVLCIVAIQGLGKKVSNGFVTVNNTLP
jgi:pilus assembly protein Flp/PilA